MKKKQKENCKAFSVTRKHKKLFIFILVCQHLNVRMLVFFSNKTGKKLNLAKIFCNEKV